MSDMSEQAGVKADGVRIPHMMVAGVYASQPANTPEREAYYALLAGEEWIDGAEIPYPGELADPQTRAWLAAHVPAHWHANTVTMIPGTMQSIGKNPDFGLASSVFEGRQAALAHLDTAREALADFAQLRGSQDVRFVEIHSGPKGRPGALASKDAMRESLETILSWDWGGAQLVIEHCDRYVDGQTPEKGFLCIEDEIDLAKELGIGITVNWGRSVVEGRSAELADKHIRACAEAGVLAGLMFSGAGPEATQYGYAWIDGHLPLSVDETTSWMTPERVAADVQLAGAAESWIEHGYVGTKVCVPADADLATRLSYMKHISEVIQHG